LLPTGTKNASVFFKGIFYFRIKTAHTHYLLKNGFFYYLQFPFFYSKIKKQKRP
jgi:hypothetical protein